MTAVDQHTPPPTPPPTPVPIPSNGRLGQGTAVEQSRAVAEVQAAVVVAQQCPRSLQAAVTMMRESCAQKTLAERAFYRFPRGGQSVSGPSVHLARELARCWGNVQYGITELRRDDEHGQSEMLAFAWDVQTNTRSMQVFIVPHKRDKRGGPEKLTDMRDIYENNANNGARRLREAIFSILPTWFTEDAKDLCTRTLADGGGKPLAERRVDAVKAFEGLGVTAEQLQERLGRVPDQWTDHDLAQLHVTYKSLERGEITIEEEFPPQRVTAAELTRRPAKVSEEGGEDDEAPRPDAAADHADADAEPVPTPDPAPADGEGDAEVEAVPLSVPQLKFLQKEAKLDKAGIAALVRLASDGRTDDPKLVTHAERTAVMATASAIVNGQRSLVPDGPDGELFLQTPDGEPAEMVRGDES